MLSSIWPPDKLKHMRSDQLNSFIEPKAKHRKMDQLNIPNRKQYFLSIFISSEKATTRIECIISLNNKTQ